MSFTLASNPNTPPTTLAALAADADEGVRHAAAGNPSTPFPVAIAGYQALEARGEAPARRAPRHYDLPPRQPADDLPR
jgi:hypothetical protein